MTRSLMIKLKPVVAILIAVAMLASMIRTTISMSSSWSIDGARGESRSSLIVPESDHAFDFDSLSAEQQRDKPFGYGPYWDVDPSRGADAWGSFDVTVRDGALAISATFNLSNPEARKGFIGVNLEPNLDINNKSDRIIRAEVKFEPALGSEQMVGSVFVYDRRDAGPNCRDDECKWYRSFDTSVGDSALLDGNELVFDLNDPSQFNTCSTCLQFTDITSDSLKNMSKIGIQFYANHPYTGTISLDNVTIGGTEIITNFVNLNEGFVTQSGSHFELNGQPYRFAGNNTYYSFYKSHYMIDDMMESMQRNGLKVVRTWGFSDGKALYANDGDGIADGNEGSAFQPELGLYYEPTFVNFDYVIKSAGERGIRLIIPLVNYWSDSDTTTGTNAFGGIAQYLEWCDIRLHYAEGRLTNKDLFYTDSCAKEAYKAYVAHMINRVNTLTNVPYKDDPTILAWELINEPRCEHAERCQGGQVLHDWAEEMSQHIKSLDPNHMVALGDEGLLSDHGNADRYYNGAFGVDWERNLEIESLDYGTVHLYPDHWGKDLVWASAWITDHITIAQEIGKPVVFEEFGICDDEGNNRRHHRHLPCNNFDRDQAYAEWIEQFEAGAAGDLLWMIAGKVNGCNEGGVELNGECYYPNYDGFTFWEPSSTMSLIREHACRLNGCTEDIILQLGWNHISWPVEPLTPLTASDLCNDINAQGGNAVEIDRWHAGGWEGHICGVPFNDFNLVFGSAYFIKSSTASSWTIEGHTAAPVPLTLQVGWNLIGIPHTDAYTAESLCDEIISQGITAVEIDRWHNAGWQGHICGLPFNDFPIERGVGYFVKASSAGTVTPSAAASRQ